MLHNGLHDRYGRIVVVHEFDAPFHPSVKPHIDSTRIPTARTAASIEVISDCDADCDAQDRFVERAANGMSV